MASFVRYKRCVQAHTLRFGQDARAVPQIFDLCVFRLDLVRDVLRNRIVVVELHGELGTARRHRTQGVDVAEHVRQRNKRVDRDCVAARAPDPDTWPRREVRSPMIPPVYSSGVITSTFMIGSSSFAPALRMPSRIHIRPAISNARTLESTSWNLPSSRATLKSITGKPARGPLSITDWMPFSTPGMYSFGTAPPTMRLSNE